MAAGSILGLLAWFSSAGAEAEEQAKADVVLRNGKIYTADKERSIKQTIAFRGNTIVAVGSDADVAPLIEAGPMSLISAASWYCLGSSTLTSIPSSARSTAPNAALPA